MKIAKTFKGNKVPKFTRWFYPFTGVFRDACYALVGSFLLQYAINSGVLSSDAAVFQNQYRIITIAMMVALVWDGINDPIMGFIVEKVHFKLGKFKPWILIGAVGNALAVVCMFVIRPGGDGWAFVWLMIAFYFLWDLFFTMNDIGYWAMLPALTNDDTERAALTSRVTIWAAVGGFLMTAVCFLLPSMHPFGFSTGQTYGAIAIAIAVLFLVSQALVFFLCQEKERDEEETTSSENSSFWDLFKVFAHDKQLRVVIIGIFLYQLSIGVLTGGIGLNLFYIMLGYGSSRGGLVSTLVSVMYVIAMISSQALYPKLVKKMSKQKIMTVSFWIQMVAYVAFILLCFPLFGNDPIAVNGHRGDAITSLDMNLAWAFGGTMFLYYLIPLIFFFGQGLMYMALLVMFQDAIDNHEYHYGERKESIISSWRPLDVKLSSAMLRLFQYLIFLAGGAYGIVTGISNAEGDYQAQKVAGNPNADAEFINTINSLMGGVTAQQINVMGILTVGVIAVSMLATYLLIHFGYTITEEEHRKIVAELEARSKKEATVAE